MRIKFLRFSLVYLACVQSGYSTLIVHDPLSTANYTIHEGLHYVQAVQTTLHTLRSYEQLVLSVAHAGNAAEIANLLGLEDVGSLLQSGQQLYAGYQELHLAVDPRNYQADMNGILNGYRLPTWQGFLTANGSYVRPNPGSYQFDTASYNVTSRILKVMNDLHRQRERLVADLDGLRRRLPSASTDAEVQKLNGNIALVQTALSDLDQKMNQTADRGRMQQEQIRAAQEIYRQTQTERQDAGIRRGIDQDFDGLNASLVHQTIDW
jgi:hypothetical protein